MKFVGAEVISQNANPLNHFPTPIKVKASSKLKVKSNSNPWHQFRKEMGKGSFTKEKYGSSIAASKARKAAYEKWKLQK
jgi:hypothetical protein